MTCRQNAPRKFFAHLTADTICSPQRLCLMYSFRKYCSSQKTLSYLGPRTWNTLPAQIKLRRSVNTFKHDIKNYFSTNCKRIPMTCVSITSQNYLIYIFIFIFYIIIIFIIHGVSVYLCSSYSPRDHNENKVYH